MRIRKTGIEKLYIDVCALCRPFDNQTNARIRLETDACFMIIERIRSGKYALIVSPAHLVEIGAMEDEPLQKRELMSMLGELKTDAHFHMPAVRHRAEVLSGLGFGAADAAHVAFAEDAADCFISCDDKLLKKCRRSVSKIECFNPVAFCVEEGL